MQKLFAPHPSPSHFSYKLLLNMEYLLESIETLEYHTSVSVLEAVLIS